MIVYTQGTFDLFHTGYVNLFKKCRKLAGKNGKVIAAVLTDESVEKYKGKPTIISFKDRATAVESCKYVDVVIPSDNTKTKQEIEEIKPDIVIVGSDWAIKDIYKQYKIKDKAWLNERLVYQPYTDEISCTEIKRRIIESNTI